MAALLLTAVGVATAEEGPHTWYVSAGGSAVHVNGARDGESVVYVAAPGGTAFGWQLALGAFVWPTVSIEAEAASTGVVKAREPSRYGMTFQEERRDLFFGVNLRFHIRMGRHVDVEPLLGVALLHENGWSQTEYHDWPVPTPTSPIEWGPKEPLEPATAGAVSVGLDLRLGGRRLAAVPSVRLRMPFHEPESIRPFYPNGSLSASLAAGMQVCIGF